MTINEVEALRDSISGDVSDVRLFAMTNYNGLGSKPRVIKFSVLDEVVEKLQSIVTMYLQSIVDEMNTNEIVGIPVLDHDQEQLVCKINQGEMLGVDGFDLDIATDYFDVRNIQLNRVRAWVVKVSTGSGDHYFMQRFVPSKMVVNDGIRIWRREDSFALVDNEILSFKATFDCFFSGQSFVVSGMDAFEAIFGYDVAYREKSESFFDQAAINQLSLALTLEGTELLREKMMLSKRFIRKLSSIMKEKRFEQIDLSRLSGVVNEYNLPLEVSIEERKLVVCEDTTCETLLSVLNDEYNTSMTTSYKYLVQKKKQL